MSDVYRPGWLGVKHQLTSLLYDLVPMKDFLLMGDGMHGKPRFWMWFAMFYFCNTQAGNIQGSGKKFLGHLDTILGHKYH